MGAGGHPRYPFWRLANGLTTSDGAALIGDEVAHGNDLYVSIGVVTDIHGETFGDGTGDTITVLPAAVTLSTGDRYPVADLVLLRRADQ